MTRIILAVAVVVATSSAARADKPAFPHSYRVDAPRGRFVFVMIPAGMSVEEDVRTFNDEFAAKIKAIRRTYSRSGMYRNDGSTDPLWTVDWYANVVTIAANGIHLIRHGPWAKIDSTNRPPKVADLDQEAFSVFASGKLLKTYQIGDLIDRPGDLRRTVSHFTWQSDDQLDDARSEYELTTLDGNRFTFDLRTGDILTADRVGRPVRREWYYLGALVAAAAVFLGVELFVIRRSSRRRTA